MKELSIANLEIESKLFAEIESPFRESSLYGVTDGKAVGTYLEHKFVDYLSSKYIFERGNSASGIDIPSLAVDIKVTSIRQPQSSCPFKSARQKIYGLGYSLLVFVYEKSDDHQNMTGRLDIKHTIYIEKDRTGDYQLSKSILELLTNDCNTDDLVALMLDKNLPLEEIQAVELAEEIIKNPPLQGYLTISNALQWRLQYGRVISVAGSVEGIKKFK